MLWNEKLELALQVLIVILLVLLMKNETKSEGLKLGPYGSNDTKSYAYPTWYYRMMGINIPNNVLTSLSSVGQAQASISAARL